jgi:hypothetical protein
MLKLLPLAITQVEPAFRNEAVRIWEDFGIDVREDGCHANNCLQVIRYAVQIKSEPSAGQEWEGRRGAKGLPRLGPPNLCSGGVGHVAGVGAGQSFRCEVC